MTTARVVIPPIVIAQIEEIGDYIAQDDPSAARRLVDRLRIRCLSLETFPYRGRPYKDGYRLLVEGRYLVFYRIEGPSDDLTAVIVAILHGARDVDALLDPPQGG